MVGEAEKFRTQQHVVVFIHLDTIHIWFYLFLFSLKTNQDLAFGYQAISLQSFFSGCIKRHNPEISLYLIDSEGGSGMASSFGHWMKR